MYIRTILTRRCLSAENFEKTVNFYETLLGQKARLRFDYPEAGLRLAQVATLLFIGGDAAALAPFRDTEATFLVDDIEGYARALPEAGCAIVRPVQPVPTGRNMLVRHPDGMLVEYVQHAAPHAQDDALAPGSSR